MFWRSSLGGKASISRHLGAPESERYLAHPPSVSAYTISKGNKDRLILAKAKKKGPSFCPCPHSTFKQYIHFPAKTEVDLHSFTRMPSSSGIKDKNLLKNHLLLVLALWKEVK